jgi:predicted MPP superfamily phosphohydrolase
MKPSARFVLLAPLIISLIIMVYGYFEARNIRTEHIKIMSPKIPEEVKKVRIVQISDIHIGLIVREERTRRIIDAVMESRPDILVSTGDFVDGQIDSLDGLSEMFQEIKPPLGKFAITGNHEFYAGLNQSLKFTEKAGFRILRGEGFSLENIINIAGVDDLAGERYGLYRNISEKELLSKLRPERFTLLLKHRPLVDKDAIGFFDLQLSGHTHKGQIFPFSLITKLYYPRDSGLVQLINSSSLYVSRGSGTWGPPVRFLSPPEVTIIDVLSEK